MKEFSFYSFSILHKASDKIILQKQDIRNGVIVGSSPA